MRIQMSIVLLKINSDFYIISHSARSKIVMLVAKTDFYYAHINADKIITIFTQALDYFFLPLYNLFHNNNVYGAAII